MPANTANTRLMSSVYSASGQLERAQEHEWIDQFIGRLRLDLLAAETLIVPDTHLFDGVFFNHITPEQLREAVGRSIHSPTIPIEIRAREKTLEHSLATFFVKRNRRLINIWPLNMIPDREDGLALRDALRGRDPEQLEKRTHGAKSIPRAVADFLRAPLHGRSGALEAVDRAEESWARWLEAEKQGWVRVRPWRGGHPLLKALSFDPLDTSELTPLGRATHEAVMKVVETSGDRADLTSVYDQAFAAADQPREQLEVETIQKWATIGRHRALAMQHGASYEYVEPDGHLPAGPIHKLANRFSSGERPAEFRDVEVHVPPSLTASLAGMEAGSYRGFCSRAAPDLRRWWSAADPTALRRVVDELVPLLPAPSMQRPRLLKICWQWAADAVGPAAAAFGTAVAGPEAGTAFGAGVQRVFAWIGENEVDSSSRALEKSIVDYCFERTEDYQAVSDD